MNRRRQSLVRAAWLVAFAITGSSCDRVDGTPGLALIAIDVSDPSPELKIRYAGLAYRAQRSLPAGSHLRIYAFGHGSALVYSGPVIAGRDTFNAKVGPVLENPPGQLLRPGTQTDLALEAWATDAGNETCPISMLILTDGGVEDESPPVLSRIRNSVEALAKRPAFARLSFAGVRAEHRQSWETRLAPLGQRARVEGERDVEVDGLLSLSEGGTP